jgi:hypothetical protein
VEERQTPLDEVALELDRIEAAVSEGNTDLSALGFWRVVGRVKRDPQLVLLHAEQVGRIDRAGFELRVRPIVSVGTGNLLLALGLVLGGALVGYAASTISQTRAGIALVAAGVVWAVAVHSPTHWAVGRLFDIHFVGYFLGGPAPPRPGLKTDYATYLRAAPDSRAWFHASGAIATKIAPFAALAFYSATGAPAWAAALLLAIGVGQIVTDATLSVKSSDWKKFRRERAIARERGIIP